MTHFINLTVWSYCVSSIQLTNFQYISKRFILVLPFHSFLWDRFLGLTVQKCRPSNCVCHRYIDYEMAVLLLLYSWQETYEEFKCFSSTCSGAAVCEWELLLRGLVEQQWASAIWRDYHSVLHKERVSVNTDRLINGFESSFFLWGVFNDFC